MDNCIFSNVTEKIRKLSVLFLVQRKKTIDIWILFTTSETLFEKMSPLKKDSVVWMENQFLVTFSLLLSVHKV